MKKAPQPQNITPLRSTLHAEDAARALLLEQLEKAESRLEGMRRGDDAQDLRVFRISLRRSRVLIGQLKRLFPPDERTHFGEEIRWISSVTGPERDLDVFLGELAAEENPGLGSFTMALRREREAAHATLLEALASERFRSLFPAWRSFLEAPTRWEGRAPDAGLPFGIVARHALARARTRLTLRSQTLPIRPTVGELHALRIDGKKLRYMVDAFSDLIPIERLEPTTVSLKRFHDMLGACQDLQVQLELLTHVVLTTLGERTTDDAQDVIAALHATLTTKQDAIRILIPQELATFDRDVPLAVIEALIEDPALHT